MLDDTLNDAEGVSIPMARSRVPSDSVWKGIQGDSIRQYGGGFPELATRDFLSLGDFIRANGGKVGNEIVDKVNAHYMAWRINSSLDVTRLRPYVSGLSKAEQKNLVEVLEQRSVEPLENGILEPLGSRSIVPMSPKVEIAAKKLKEWFKEIADQSNERGILHGYHENYWPHMRPTELMRDPKFKAQAEEAIAWQHAVMRIAEEKGISPQAVKRADVSVQYVDRAYGNDQFESFLLPQLARIAPNLEQLRVLDIPGYEIDPMMVLRRYAQAARQRIAEHDVWGPRDSLHGLPAMAKEQFDYVKSQMTSQVAQSRLENYKQNAFGYSPYDPRSLFSRTIGDMQALKMSLSVLSNISQPVNTALRTSTTSFLKAYGKLMGDGEVVNGVGARQFALMSGLITDNVLKDAALYQGSRFGENVLTYTGFLTVEKLNRMHAAVAGAVFLDEQYKAAVKGSKKAVIRLRELGMDIGRLKQQNGPMFNDYLVAARRIVDETQFIYGPSDMPKSVLLSDPRLRWLLEFKTFTYNQTRMVIREMQRRPARMLVFGLGVMPAVGAGVSFLRQGVPQLIGAQPSEFQQTLTPWQEYVEGMAAASSWGLASDLLWAVEAGSKTNQEPWKTVMPPRMSTAVDALAAMSDLRASRNKEAMKTFMRQFGGIGSAFGRAMFPAQR
jgi:hypothetical protein